jgi:2-dehydro-3-deoxyphosphooctonate aldolase (KDO 8-P synthase)
MLNNIQNINHKDSGNFFLIAGPCAIEGDKMSIEIAEKILTISNNLKIPFIFKGSYRKANRSRIDSFTGIGDLKALEIIKKIGTSLNIPTTTDIHSADEALLASKYVDILQIPAFLCRQTDLLQAACSTDKIVNIKKGQFLAPWDVKGILSKCTDAKEVWITERGTSFGYNSLVVDYTGLIYMLDNYDNDIVFDVTHSVQKPGGLGDSSGGNRDYVPGLARAGSALGITSFFIEVHPMPDDSPSDGPNMLRLDDFEQVVDDLVKYQYEQ